MKYKKPDALFRSKFFPRSAMILLTTLILIVSGTTTATAQTYTDLYNFGSSNEQPNDPQYSGIIAQGRDGNLYSTTNQNWTAGLGDVFMITPTGTLTVLHTFEGTDGAAPVGGLTLATNGMFYGTTSAGGDFGFGTIFSVTAKGALTTLYSFTNGSDGSVPKAPPIQGIDGNFYGTTMGASGNNGSVYKITSTGVFTTLYSFDGAHGANPIAPLVQASNGDFYGTTFAGGAYGAGTVFRISCSGKLQVLFSFGPVPGYPIGPLIQGGDGNFYGTTAGAASASSGGIVFKITPAGTLFVLHTFVEGIDGSNPVGGLVLATDGNFYGTNCIGPVNFAGGILFRIDSIGTFAALHGLNSDTGASAQDTLFQHTSGMLYGTTAVGGSFTRGTFYSFDVGTVPFVSFLPAAGSVGREIQFLGQGFTGTTAVSFNGVPATFTVVRDTYLTATVPQGATTGFVRVSSPGGTLTSSREFQVRP